VSDEAEPIAYSVLEKGVPLLAQSGKQFGTVEHVLQIPEEDLFDGIVVATACDSSTAIKSTKSLPPTFAAPSWMKRLPHCLRLRAQTPSQQMPHRTPGHRCTTDSVECSAERDGPKRTD
jgi:hypothetical protein